MGYNVEEVSAGFIESQYPVSDHQNTEDRASEAFKMNDAVVLGDLDDALMSRKISLAMSPHGMATRPGKWSNTNMNVGQLVNMLSKHETGEKDGKSICQGAVVDRKRTSQSVRQNEILMLDLDTGANPEALIHRVQELGLFCIAWSTHSHLKPVTSIKKDAVMRWAEIEDEPSLDDCVRYLREVKGYEAWVLEGAELLDPEHTADGVQVRVKHAPLPKTRLLFVLEKPFNFAKAAVSQKKAIDLWKGKYAGVSVMLGAAVDRSCVDPARLMFTPRHPKDAEDFWIKIIPGRPLDLETVKPAAFEKRGRGRGGDVFDQYAAEHGAKGGEFQTPWLKRWLARYATTFDAEQFLRDYGEERRERRGVGHHFKCPNDDMHSNAGDEEDNGFFVVSAQDNTHGEGFVAKCMHDSCMELDRAAMLDLMIVENGLEEADLEPYVGEIEEEAPAAAVTGARKGSDLPEGYRRSNAKICVVRGSGDDQKLIPICGDLSVIGRTRDEKGKSAGLIVSLKTDGGEVEMTISARRIHEDPTHLRGDLMDVGFWISKKNAADFDELLTGLTADRLIITASSPGWRRDQDGKAVFVTPLGLVVGGGGDWRLKEGAGVETAQSRGDLAAWSEAANTLALLNPHWAIGAGIGFAGCLADLIEDPTCGFLFAGVSSRGKTVALSLAASVWTTPQENKGVLTLAKSTTNAFEATAARATGSFLGVDELKLLPGKEVSQLIFGLAGGSGKQRMRKEGGLRASTSWRTFFAMSSEKSAKDIVESAGEVWLPGAAVRMPTIIIDESAKSVDKKTLDSLKRVLAENYGLAGPAFASHLINDGVVDDLPSLRDRVFNASVSIAGDYGQRSDILARAARPFALVAVASTLAADAGLISDDALEAVLDALQAAFNRFAESTDSGSGDPVGEALDKLAATLNARIGVDVLEIDAGHRSREAVAFYNNRGRVFVRTDKLSDLAGGKVSDGALVKALKQQGILIDPKRADRRLYVRHVPGVGKIACYELDGEALGFNMIDVPDSD